MTTPVRLSGSSRTHNKSKMYDEESWKMPITIVQKIMQHESCVAIPMMQPVTTQKLYYVAIRDMDTQQEYMHPDPIASLDNYQVHFLNCPLLRACDMSVEIKAFPLLKNPGEMGMGPVSMELVKFKSGKLLKITAVASPGEDNITVFMESPPLPMNESQYHQMYPTSMDKRFCLMRYSMLSLAEDVGMDLEPHDAKDISVGLSTEERKDIELQHGKDVLAGNGVRTYVLSGSCSMYEREPTAATVSLPMVLKYLYFLQFNLDRSDTDLTYHIMAPNKFVYMVHLPNVAGWKIYYQVNMNASYEALQYAFAESQSLADITRMMRHQTTSDSIVSNMLGRMTLNMMTLKSSLVLDKLLRSLGVSKQTLQDSSSQENQPPGGGRKGKKREKVEAFQSEMRMEGLKLLEKDILQLQAEYRTLNAMQEARPLLQYLISFFTTLGLNRTNHQAALLQVSVPAMMTTHQILAISLEAFQGCVEAVWDDCKKPDDQQDDVAHVQEFLEILRTRAKDCFAFMNADYIPIILNGCMRCPPKAWWEIIANNCSVHDPLPAPPVNINACLCSTLLYASHMYATYFPSSLFWDPKESMSKKKVQEKWEEVLSNALLPNSAVLIAKNCFTKLCTFDKDRFVVDHPEIVVVDGAASPDVKLKISEMKQKRKKDYCMAISYLMLRGNAEADIANLKIM